MPPAEGDRLFRIGYLISDRFLVAVVFHTDIPQKIRDHPDQVQAVEQYSILKSAMPAFFYSLH